MHLSYPQGEKAYETKSTLVSRHGNINNCFYLIFFSSCLLEISQTDSVCLFYHSAQVIQVQPESCCAKTESAQRTQMQFSQFSCPLPLKTLDSIIELARLEAQRGRVNYLLLPSLVKCHFTFLYFSFYTHCISFLLSFFFLGVIALFSVGVFPCSF